MVTISMDDGRDTNKARILVVGTGGGGGNAVENMVRSGLEGVSFVVANTDMQALEKSSADFRIQLGKERTRGLGAGADPSKGREAALENKGELGELMKGYDMVFVTAGMGGGTGTGAAPVIAEAARAQGALTVAVVTKPFMFEGMPRMRNAMMGIAELRKYVDALIVIPNDRLLQTCNEPTSLLDALGMADGVLRDAVKSISDLIVVPGLINVDFADACRIMKGKGKAIMGMGEGSGEGRAAQAAQKAMTSSLLEESSIDGATGILINITGAPDIKIQEINEAMSLIQKAVDPCAEIIMGTVIDPNLTDKIKITVIATGFDTDREFGRDEQMAAEIGMDTAAPGQHWTSGRQPAAMSQKVRQAAMLQQQMGQPMGPRTQGMLAREQQQQQQQMMPQQAQAQRMPNMPPPMPNRQEAVAVPVRQSTQVKTGVMPDRTPTLEDDFDPTRTTNWF
jgi:cell division protein FtsZ